MGYATLTIIALASVIGLLPSLRSGWGAAGGFPSCSANCLPGWFSG